MKSSEEELVAIVKAYSDALNDHDLEAAMACFTDDVVCKVGPPPAPPGSEFVTGKQQLRSVMRPQLPGFHVEAWDYRASGDTVTFRFKYSNDLFRNEGVESLEGTIEAVCEGDKIKLWTQTLSPQTMEKLGANLTGPP